MLAYQLGKALRGLRQEHLSRCNFTCGFLIKGNPLNGAQAPAKTRFYGLYDRATVRFQGTFELPFALQGRAKLDLADSAEIVRAGGASKSPGSARDP